MNHSEFLEKILLPGLVFTEKHTDIPVSKEATQFLLTTAATESGLEFRFQLGNYEYPGPARGWFQFEVIGTHEVMLNRSTKEKASAIIEACDLSPNHHAVWRALEGHDNASVAFARLLLWTVSAPLPKTEPEAWKQYKNKTWRPGKPHRASWSKNWVLAHQAISILDWDFK